jgi:hypothetical protein
MGSITPALLWSIVAWVAAAIVLLANAGEKIAKIVQAAKAPNTKQDERLRDLEEWRKEVDKRLARGNDHFETIDESNRVTQVALLALLDHGLDGNNKTQMQHAKEELQQHLINK